MHSLLFLLLIDRSLRKRFLPLATSLSRDQAALAALVDGREGRKLRFWMNLLYTALAAALAIEQNRLDGEVLMVSAMGSHPGVPDGQVAEL